jgi:facilitated trehalose transporter
VEKFSWIDSIRKPQVFKPLLILSTLFLLQQLSGGYVLIFYTINIFRNLGSDFANSINENLASLLLGTIRFIMAIVAAILSQRCNRKTLLYISTIGMSAFAFLSAIKMSSLDGSGHSFFLRHAVGNQSKIIENSSTTIENYFLLACILSYILFASLGLLIIPWTCIAELFPTKYKAKYGGLTVALAYILMSIVLRIFPFMLDSMSISTIFIIFGTSSFACGVFIYFFLPETHRRTFSEIENYFIGKS